MAVGIPIGAVCLAALALLLLRHIRHKKGSRLIHAETLGNMGGEKELGLGGRDDGNTVVGGTRVSERAIPGSGGGDSVQASELYEEIPPAYPSDVEGSPGARRIELA